MAMAIDTEGWKQQTRGQRKLKGNARGGRREARRPGTEQPPWGGAAAQCQVLCDSLCNKSYKGWLHNRGKKPPLGAEEQVGGRQVRQ